MGERAIRASGQTPTIWDLGKLCCSQACFSLPSIFIVGSRQLAELWRYRPLATLIPGALSWLNRLSPNSKQWAHRYTLDWRPDGWKKSKPHCSLRRRRIGRARNLEATGLLFDAPASFARVRETQTRGAEMS